MTIDPGLVRAGLAVVALALAGACAFGVWHVVVGGLVNGNARAATFGVVLAIAAGMLLGAVTLAARRGRRA